MKRYFDNWADHEAMVRDFSGYSSAPLKDIATDVEILFAAYSSPGYDGYAKVLFERGGELFEVYGSHCSCNGLEDQWKPAPVTWAALALRVPNWKEALKGGYSDDTHGLGHQALETLISLVEARS